MPFLRVDAYEGRSKEQVKELLDAIHRAILSAFGVPLRDRYQVYQEHSESNRTPGSVSIAPRTLSSSGSQADNEPRSRRQTSIRSSLRN